MCGIVGYVGSRPVQEILLSGLEKLEYRGYDSAGIAVVNEDHEMEIRRARKARNRPATDATRPTKDARPPAAQRLAARDGA